MDTQEYINETVNERLDKLETKVDSLENKITNIEISNAKQMIILEKIEKNVEVNNTTMTKTQNKIFWGNNCCNRIFSISFCTTVNI